jgi:nitronate monooxygenase
MTLFHFKQLSVPVIQAPMAGGICTPELVAAVANAGGVGSFGFAYSSPEKINADLAAAKALTDGPMNANFFVFSPVDIPSLEVQTKAIQALKRLPIETDFIVAAPEGPYFPALEQQLEPIWVHRPAILTFHLGIPAASIIEKAHTLGICVGITATNAEEALAAEQAGADFIVAQGIEAGGHRGTFEPNAQQDQRLTTIELTQVLALQCTKPIVAAGAIMHGSDIALALTAGATATQLGTAFLCCDESGASEEHQDFLLNQAHRGSTLTKVFSGRLARAIQNDFTHSMVDQTILPFPIQNALTASIRQWANKTHNGDYQSLWAGTAYAKIRKMSAKALIETLQQELLSTKGLRP